MSWSIDWIGGSRRRNTLSEYDTWQHRRGWGQAYEMTTDLTLSDAAISLSDRQIYIPDSFRIMGGGQGGIQVWATAPVSNSARYTRPAVMTSGNHRVLRTATPQGASPSRPRLTTKPLTTSIASKAGGGGTTDSALPCRLKGQPCLAG